MAISSILRQISCSFYRILVVFVKKENRKSKRGGGGEVQLPPPSLDPLPTFLSSITLFSRSENYHLEV